MILAEIADKMRPISFYWAAIVVSGSCAAAAFVFLRGIQRALGIAIITVAAGLLAFGLQVDSDLVDAARSELGQTYITISRYWIIAAVLLAFALTVVFRCSSRSNRFSQQLQSSSSLPGRNSLRVLGVLIGGSGLLLFALGGFIYSSRYEGEHPELVERVRSGIVDESVGGVIDRSSQQVGNAALVSFIAVVILVVGIYVWWPMRSGSTGQPELAEQGGDDQSPTRTEVDV